MKKIFKGCCLFVSAFILLAIGLVVGSIYFYIDGVPTIAGFVVDHAPTSIDQEMGRKAHNDLVKKAPIDQEKTQLLNAFYDELHYNSRTKLYVIHFNQFNAFALPDNSIFVFDEVFKHINAAEELAALLGHEYAHIKNRHGLKGVAQDISWSLLGSLISGGNSGDQLIDNANMLLSLKNSRKFETEADLDGVALMREKRINPQGMIDLCKTMLALPQEEENPTPAYLSTHPDTEDRLEDIQKELTKANDSFKSNERLNALFLQLKN